MATRPTNDLLVWANTDVNLPNLAGPNKTEPSADLVAKGWDFKQKPSADEFNYILNNLGEWVEYLKTVVIEATPEATANTLALRDTNGDVAARYFVGDLNGNADTATKWQTPRTITFNGDAVGSVVLNGDSNVSCNLTVSSASSISVITGYVSSGNTIPLPSGYTEAQCCWTVSPQQWYDNAGDGGYDYWTMIGRVVTGKDVTNFHYMCIGVK